MTARNVHQWLITAPAPVFDVLLDITKERSDQEDAGYTPEHDDELGVQHLLIEAYERLAVAGYDAGAARESRDTLVEIAALLVAAVEAHDRRVAVL